MRKWPKELSSFLLNDSVGYCALEEDLAQWKGASLDHPQSLSDQHILEQLTEFGFSVPPQAATSKVVDRSRVWSVYSPVDAWGQQRMARYRNMILPTVLDECRVVSLSKIRDRIVGLSLIHISEPTRPY